MNKLVEEEGLLNWKERGLIERLAAALDAHFSQRFYGILEEAKVCYLELTFSVQLRWSCDGNNFAKKKEQPVFFSNKI